MTEEHPQDQSPHEPQHEPPHETSHEVHEYDPHYADRYYSGNERWQQQRTSSRDWLKVFLQALGIIVIVGLPGLIAGINMNSEIAVLNSRLDRVERDTISVKNYQDLTSTQMLELNRQLASIAAQVTDIRDVVKSERKN